MKRGNKYTEPMVCAIQTTTMMCLRAGQSHHEKVAHGLQTIVNKHICVLASLHIRGSNAFGRATLSICMCSLAVCLHTPRGFWSVTHGGIKLCSNTLSLGSVGFHAQRVAGVVKRTLSGGRYKRGPSCAHTHIANGWRFKDSPQLPCELQDKVGDDTVMPCSNWLAQHVYYDHVHIESIRSEFRPRCMKWSGTAREAWHTCAWARRVGCAALSARRCCQLQPAFNDNGPHTTYAAYLT